MVCVYLKLLRQQVIGVSLEFGEMGLKVGSFDWTERRGDTYAHTDTHTNTHTHTHTNTHTQTESLVSLLQTDLSQLSQSITINETN